MSKQKNIIETGFNDNKAIIDTLKEYFSWDRKILKLFFMYIALIIVFSSVVHVPFIDSQGSLFEDTKYIENEIIQSPSLANTVNVFTEITGHQGLEGFYQPLTILSLMLDTALGENTEGLTGYNRTNFIIHMVNVLLLYFLLVVLLKKVNIALFVSLIFSLHPMAGQLILRASGRGILLGTLFGILTILFYTSYVKKKDTKMYILGVFSFILCLLSNITLIFLPLTFVFIERWPLRIVSSKDMYRRFAIKLPFFGASLVFIFILLISFVFNLSRVMAIGQERFLVLFYNISKYFQEFFWPVQISPFFSFQEKFNIYNINVLFGILIFIAFIMFITLAFKKWIEIFDCLGIFVAMVLPILSLSIIRPDIARIEQFYFASLGLGFLSSYLISRIWVKLSTKDFLSKNVWSFIFVSIAAIIIIFLSMATLNEKSRWNSNESILEYTAEKLETNQFLYFEIAKKYDKVGMYERAIEYFEKSENLGNQWSTLKLSYLLLKKGNDTLAIEYFIKALNETDLEKSKEKQVLYELKNLKAYEELIDYWEKVKLENKNVQVLEELLGIYIKKEDLKNTYIYTEKILKLEPERFNLLKLAANYNFEHGDLKKALKYAEMALEIDDGDVELQKILMESNVILDRALEEGFYNEDS